MSVSICMATYNGEPYLEAQLASILPQMRQADELIIVDDRSTDSTPQRLRSLRDPRIRIFENEENQGVNRSFERAISLSTREYVLLADQDDEWIEGRADLLVSALEGSGSLVVSSNTEFMDREGQPIVHSDVRLSGSDSNRFAKNILAIFWGSAPYYGCAMGFRREAKGLILPFPRFIESHDLWIALASNMARSNLHVEGSTLRRRIHGANASVVRRNLPAKVWSRFVFCESIAVLLPRVLRYRSES